MVNTVHKSADPSLHLLMCSHLLYKRMTGPIITVYLIAEEILQVEVASLFKHTTKTKAVTIKTKSKAMLDWKRP